MLRPLPRLVAPFRDETITSYLHRLAGPNRIDPAGLRLLLAGSDRKDAPVPLGRLAAVTGMPCAVARLRDAADLHRRPNCPACTSRDRPRARDGWSFAACRPAPRAAGHPVGTARRRRLLPAPPLDQQRPRAARPHRQPEILHAHRRHRRLIRRHGRDPVMRAFRDAQPHLHRLAPGRLPDPGFDRRMEIFHGPGWHDRDDDEPHTSDAAAYPQSVALTRLLASPYWRERILGKGWAWHDEFDRRTTPHRRPRLHLGLPPAHPLAPRPRRPAARMAIPHPPPAFEPLPPGHHWNLPETIQTGGGDLLP